jgi:protein-S-isoprenylcysteine O-methyltransferase Ste14
MRAFNWIVLSSWAAFVITWLGAAGGSKRTARHNRADREVQQSRAMVAAIAGFMVVIALLHFLLPRLPKSLVTPPAGVARGVLGSTLCVIGVAYAVWARLTLGRNWGLPMSQKEQPELVTAGPYARVRHPIYAGVVLALLGSAVVTGIAELIVALAMAAYFLASAFREERHLRTEFPEAFPAYQGRTKRFIPFLF